MILHGEHSVSIFVLKYGMNFTRFTSYLGISSAATLSLCGYISLVNDKVVISYSKMQFTYPYEEIN